jgi:hypothetical protein
MTLGDLIFYIKANRNKGRVEAFGWTDDELVAYILTAGLTLPASKFRIYKYKTA